MRIVSENVGFDQLPGRLSQLAFVVFNYDRALEHFLLHWIMNYFDVDEPKAGAALSHVEIHHPYGVVGQLPWNEPQSGVAYGAAVNSRTLLALAGGIRTFTEGMDSETGGIGRIRERVSSSSKVVFLGFAFHPINMQLLRPEMPAAPGTVCFATSKGISDFARGSIRADLAKWITANETMVHMKNGLTCSELFAEYGRGLTMTE